MSAIAPGTFRPDAQGIFGAMQCSRGNPRRSGRFVQRSGRLRPGGQVRSQEGFGLL